MGDTVASRTAADSAGAPTERGPAAPQAGAREPGAPGAVVVAFVPGGEMAQVAAGTSLLDAAAAAGVEIAAPCGGQGRCGRCRVTVAGEGVERRDHGRLTAAEVAAGVALACQSRVTGSIEVTLPPRAREQVRPHGHAVAEPEALPVSCDWRR